MVMMGGMVEMDCLAGMARMERGGSKEKEEKRGILESRALQAQ